MQDDGFEGKTKTFMTWLSKVGVVVSSKVSVADLRNIGRGRGIVALENLAEDELVFSVPRSAVLNISTARDHSQLFGGQVADTELPPWLRLTCILLAESLHSSPWSPYLAILPTTLDNLSFWSDAELFELQASSVRQKIGKASAEAFFMEHIMPFAKDKFTIDICHHYASIIMAYAFDIPKNDLEAGSEDGDNDDFISDNEEDSSILSMVVSAILPLLYNPLEFNHCRRPLADLLNADADSNNARLFCDNGNTLEMRTIRPIPAGKEILNDYGPVPQSDLLRRYGYVTDNYAQYNVAEISISLILSAIRRANSSLNDADLQARLELASREDIYDDTYDVLSSCQKQCIPTDLVALVYLLLLDDTNLKKLQRSEDDFPKRSRISTELVGQQLLQIFKLREQEYATTLEEDEVILSGGDLSSRLKMAIKVRLGEKRVLREAMLEATNFGLPRKRKRVDEAED